MPKRSKSKVYDLNEMYADAIALIEAAGADDPEAYQTLWVSRGQFQAWFNAHNQYGVSVLELLRHRYPNFTIEVAGRA